MKVNRNLLALQTLRATFTFHPSRLRRKSIALAHMVFWLGFGGQASLLLAQPPALINYQGRLVSGTNLVSGTVALTFRIHTNAAGGNFIFEATNLAVVADGLYATQFGDATATTNTLLSLNQALNAGGLNQSLWLEIAVNGTDLSPRERLLSVPYARQTYGLYADFNNIMLGAPNSQNTIPDFSQRSVIGGGSDNKMSGAYVDNSVIAGGRQHVIDTGFGGQDVTISGGRGNAVVESDRGAIGGGVTNRIVFSEGAQIGGGATNRILASPYAVIGGGDQNLIYNTSPRAVISGGQKNQILTNAGHGVIGGGQENVIDHNTLYAFIGGGQNNAIGSGSGAASIGGGSFNFITGPSPYSTIGGGAGNLLRHQSFASVVGGGWLNVIGATSQYAVISGGSDNSISNVSSYSTVAGGQNNRIGSSSTGGAISGGQNNQIGPLAQYGTIGGGQYNRIEFITPNGVVAGGFSNRLHQAWYSAIGGGAINSISNSDSSVISGGEANRIADANTRNVIVGGGLNMITNAQASTIAGGENNLIGASFAFAAGSRVRALHNGTFLWGDNATGTVASTAANQTTFRSTGGFRIFTSASQTSGVQVAANSGAWTSISDVNAKEAFDEVDTQEILAKVAQLPITTWRYKGQDAEIRHMGPTAQDFAAAFGLGDAPGHGITTVDADGVALAAIQALAKEKERLEKMVSVFGDQVSGLEAENQALRERLEALEKKLGM